MILTLTAFPALACSFIGYKVFAPDSSTFKPKYDKNDKRVSMPAPVPRIISVQRGTTLSGAECTDMGLLEVDLAWPTDSAYALDEVGFYFRVISAAEDADSIFPDRPVTGTVARNRILLSWPDGHPSRQRALDLKVEVFAVNEGLQVGPSAYFDLKVLPGEHRGPPLVPIG
ncbi:MAG TPA: hypothetical protein VK624_05875 [Steroidobacteraceae bacterium]|nr:hypothetical protein [Steroidobacteraceae bacterium]